MSIQKFCDPATRNLTRCEPSEPTTEERGEEIEFLENLFREEQEKDLAALEWAAHTASD